MATSVRSTDSPRPTSSTPFTSSPHATGNTGKAGSTVHDAIARLREVRARSRRRPLWVSLALVIALLGTMMVRVLLGSYTVTIPDFFTIIHGGTVEGARAANFIVLSDKLPRAVLGLLAGAAFGASGAIFQLLLRNPLASPDIIGISSGASLGAVLAIVFWGASGFTVSVFAVVFSLAVAVAIMLLSAGQGSVGNRFILMGIGVAALGSAVVSYLMSRTSTNTAQAAAVWMTGSLSIANWNRITILLILLCVLLPLVALLHKKVHTMAVGEELAHGIGLNVSATRWTFIVLGVLLAAVATAATGPIAFVAFVSGPIARRLIGGRHSIFASALVGAIIVVLADFIAANYMPGGALPVGILTGALGAPVLIWLLTQSQKEGK